MPPERAAGIVARCGMPQLAKNTLIGLPALLYNEHREPFSTISVSDPALRFPPHRIPSLGKFVKGAAQRITPALGGPVVPL
ncbi:MAG: hypothetical protein JWL84_5340 [Rhodospirillales bacterium]|nr:hypothetical protein [Rhodospirillales bacterium]